MTRSSDQPLNRNPLLDSDDPLLAVFSAAWMREYARLWNAEQAMVRELTRQRFSALLRAFALMPEVRIVQSQ